ncbi:hypothetical protein BDV93DRAFT_546494 [Ceratobasidium sp. AG-I]|nr:hypothetical protein BDV93DRAFT_546494 [Ceratobasidium sp. AG-I]
MVRVDSHQNNTMAAIYTPPRLPSYFSNSFNLKPVTGVPSDAEVKMIHAAIRTVDSVSHVSALCDLGLTMDLAQHLFDVQMARYRDKYPVNIFPSTNTFTPPTLPSHINVSLDPVTGVPSDDEVKLVHLALRASENLANAPVIFDPDLSMNLSQHLFNIQFARYIQRSTEGHHTVQDGSPSDTGNPETGSSERPAERNEIRGVPSNTALGLDQPAFEHEGDPVTHGSRSISHAPSTAVALSEDARGIIEQLKINLEQTDQRLVGIQDVLRDELKDGLKNVTRLMIKLHNHSARGFNSEHAYAYHHIVDENGGAPTTYAVPHVQHSGGTYFWNWVEDSTLAQYLQYYNLAAELLEQGDTVTLKPNSADQAREILGRYTHTIT